MASRKITIGVIGGGETTPENYRLAYDVGRFIAGNGAVLICGGLSGAMEAASKGAFENNGCVIGFLPGENKSEANAYVQIAIPTGMGIGRNVLVVRASDALIAFPGSYGTLSEISLALCLGKTVVYMPGTWDLKKIAAVDSALFKEAFDASQAIGFALNSIRVKDENPSMLP